MFSQILKLIPRNDFERIVIVAGAQGTLRFDIPTCGPETARATNGPIGQGILTERMRRELDRQNILAALERSHGKISGPGSAAELLGTKPTTLRSRIKALGIRAEAR